MDLNLVLGLQSVDQDTLSSDEFTVVLGVHFQGMGGLVGPLPSKNLNVMSASFTLGLGSFQLYLTFIDVDIDVKFVAKLTDMASAFADKLVSMLLREVKSGQNETTLLFVGNGGLNEGIDLSSKRLDSWSWATECDRSTRCSDSDWDVIVASVSLFFFDELLQLVVMAT